jgi:RHS repeat-associated protein
VSLSGQCDAGGARTKQILFDGLTNVTKKVYATPAYEMKETLINPTETNRADWVWEMNFCRIYVDTPAGRIGIYQQEGLTNGVGAVTRSYIHKDHLGSVVAVSDSSANITFKSYDAWGQERDADNWRPLSDPITDNPITDRGYTGHEMLSGLDLIHMNGRIYDPVIGHMISPDPLIQAPDNLQSFNRYAYVFNNPLSLTDPSEFVTQSTGTSAEAGGDSGDYSEPISSGSLAEDYYISDSVVVVFVDPEYGNIMGAYGIRVTVDSSGNVWIEERIKFGDGYGSFNDVGQYGLDTGAISVAQAIEDISNNYTLNQNGELVPINSGLEPWMFSEQGPPSVSGWFLPVVGDIETLMDPTAGFWWKARYCQMLWMKS